MTSGRPTTVRVTGATRTTADRSAQPTRRAVAGPVALGRYRLARRLGAGAFGTVWMAHDERLDRAVAVKILPRQRVNDGRFEREARAAARLSHPAIVTLYEAAVDDEGAYLVSELVAGETLDALLAAGRLSDRDVIGIGIALCDALAHAHAQGIVHRDVKPSNVLIPEAPAPAAPPAKLTDFGIARVIGGDTLTRTGDVLGTEAYMAPEQAEGLPVGPSADLYSLALVLYEALTGVNPVATGDAVRRARRLGTQLPPLRRQRRDLPRALAHPIDMALRPRPRERGSIGALRHALAASIDLVGDEPGVIAAPWRPSEVTRTLAHGPLAEPREPLARQPLAEPSGPPPPPQPPAPHPLGITRAQWPARGLAAAAAAVLGAWVVARLSVAAPVTPAVAGLAGATAVLLLPRLGWAALVIALTVAALAAHQPGGALVIALAALIPVLLMPGSPTAWPLAAAAPALGLIGLAGAWPALAARARGSWRRAALGAIGWLWLAVAAALTHRTLYLPLPAGVGAPAAWEGSPGAAVHHVLGTLAAAGVLAPAGVWALSALVVPWAVSGRFAALDVARVAVWSALTAAAVGPAVVLVHGADPVGSAPSAVIGALAGAAVALAPVAVARWRAALRSPGSPAGVS